MPVTRLFLQAGVRCYLWMHPVRDDVEGTFPMHDDPRAAATCAGSRVNGPDTNDRHLFARQQPETVPGYVRYLECRSGDYRHPLVPKASKDKVSTTSLGDVVPSALLGCIHVGEPSVTVMPAISPGS